MVPDVVPPIIEVDVGTAKLPVPSETWAVNVLPALNTPVMVNGTLMVEQAQKGLPTIAPKVMLLAEGVARVISSMATEGSVPTPSSLFFQRKPIFTLATLLQATGNATEYAVHRPCGEQVPNEVMAGVDKKVHDVPLLIEYSTVIKSLPAIPCNI